MRPVLALGVAVLLSACATAPRIAEIPGDSTPKQQDCTAFFARLDDAVLQADARDGVGPPVSGYPWFRSSRTIEFMADGLSAREYAAALLDHDRHARSMELQNLPAWTTDRLVRGMEQKDPGTAVLDCGDLLTERMLAEDPDLELVRATAAVPDDYITWHRWAGLYPISRFGILAGVSLWHDRVKDEFMTDAPRDRPGLRYSPAESDAVTLDSTVRNLVASAPRDALGRMALGRTKADLLLAAYAPIIEVESDRGHNRIGEPLWEEAGKPNVNVAFPLVYTSISHMRFDGETVPQLNYTFWFSSRPKKHFLDVLGGRLDGMTVRVTLNNAGEALLLETMHNCGCYHQHYPLSGLSVREDPDYVEPPLVLDSPGAPRQGERLVIGLRDRSHYVARVYRAEASAGSGRGYVLQDYDRLRSLPLKDGRRSLFNADGLVEGTHRDERVIFWVSGVPDPGAMRQMGRHVTAFAGRRHFDDPDLLDRIFVPD